MASRRSAWGHARELAAKTPESRNRYVDFLRALSITAVVTGHWLIAAPWVEAGRLRLDHMLDLAPWTRWLTWLFQVMPIFFIVGGYSNAASWEAARRGGVRYGAWLTGRLRRLLGPVVPLLIFWTLAAMIAHRAGVRPEIVKIGSQAALVPVWFLAVYTLAVLLVPVTRAAWRAAGVGSFWALALAAVAVDAIGLGAGVGGIRWTNYAFVWLAVHQLGYLWRDGRVDNARQALPWAALGATVLAGLVTLGGYPLSMVGVPGEEVSNTLPPTLAMLALGCLQAGLLLSLQGPARRRLAGTRTWAATILVNGMIMSVYLWHLTAMVVVVGLSNVSGRFGLGLVPGSAAWWATRPLWMALLLVALLPFLLVFSRFERNVVPATDGFPAWRGVAGALLAGTALALLALDGVGGPGALGVRSPVLLTALAGVWLAGAAPQPRSR